MSEPLLVDAMKSSPRVVALLILATLIFPLTVSQISLGNERGGLDAAGEWQPRHSLEIHDEWWEDWSRDKNQDKIDDRPRLVANSVF